MVGGLIQLAAYGAEDLYLTGNPQITFFKMVYKRHTNFAMENIEQQFEGAGGNLEFSRKPTDTTGGILRCKIPKDGDLISNMYFGMRVPNIYTFEDNSGQSTVSYYFYWSKFLALNMIKSIHINIGNSEIDLHYSEWLQVYNELYSTAEQKKVFYRLIGHIEEMYNPTNSEGNYPVSVIDENRSPSIIERNVYIPLNFWFNIKPGLALPLIALDDKTSTVELKIELNTIDQFYILERHEPTASILDNRKYKLKPDLSNPKHSILNFLVGDDASAVGWGLRPHLEINYIFLDKRERELFAKIEHDYLMEQVIRRDFLNINQSEYTVTLRNLYHPVKYIVLVLKRSDVVDRNDHNNYTNWFDNELDPLMGTSQYKKWKDPVPNLENRIIYKEPTITRDNYTSYKRDIIEEAVIRINGMDRIKEKPGTYFNLVQKYQHNLESDETGIYVYSFAINPTKIEPSGSCNMSRVDTLEFKFRLLPLPDTSYTYEMNMYFVNYNILRIMGGMASLVFESVS